MMLWGLLLLLAAVASHGQLMCRDFTVRARLDKVPKDFVVQVIDNITGDTEWQSTPVIDQFADVTETTCLDPSKCWKATVFDSEINKDG